MKTFPTTIITFLTYFSFKSAAALWKNNSVIIFCKWWITSWCLTFIERNPEAYWQKSLDFFVVVVILLNEVMFILMHENLTKRKSIRIRTDCIFFLFNINFIYLHDNYVNVTYLFVVYCYKSFLVYLNLPTIK